MFWSQVFTYLCTKLQLNRCRRFGANHLCQTDRHTQKGRSVFALGTLKPLEYTILRIETITLEQESIRMRWLVIQQAVRRVAERAAVTNLSLEAAALVPLPLKCMHPRLSHHYLRKYLSEYSELKIKIWKIVRRIIFWYLLKFLLCSYGAVVALRAGFQYL